MKPDVMPAQTPLTICTPTTIPSVGSLRTIRLSCFSRSPFEASEPAATPSAAAAAPPVPPVPADTPPPTGLHSITFQLNYSASRGIGGAFRGCLGGVLEV